MTVSEKHTGLRIIGPRPVERNGLRGFVTTFHFGNTHSPDSSSHQVNSPASTSSPGPGTNSSRSALSAGSDGNPSKPSPADGCVKMDGASTPVPDRPDAKSACIRAEAGQAVSHSHASRNGEG